MLNRIKSLLSSGPAEEPANELERIQVATCTVLIEMAHADEEFHPMEGQLIRDLLRDKFGISEASAAELIELSHQERKESLDLFSFTREINDNFRREEKLALMESLWRIVYADGVLDKYEDYLVRKLANLLRLSHREMIDAKVKVLDEGRGR